MRSLRLALLATLLALAPTAVRAQPFAYVLASDWDGATSVRVINTATRNELAKISIPGGTFSAPAAVDLAVSPAGDRLYVVSPGPTAPRLLVIETSPNSISSSVAVGAGPTAVAVSPDGSRVYVANGGDNTVSVVDASTLAVLTTIPVGQGPSDIAASSDGLAVYVANRSDNTVWRIGTATNTVTGTVGVAAGPIVVRLRGDGAGAYVLSNGPSGGVMSVVDTAAMTVLSTRTVYYARGLAVLPDGSRVFVGSHETLNITRSLVAIDLATGTTTRVPDVFPNAVLGRIGLALDASAARLFVTTGGVDAIDVNTLGRVSALRIAEGTAIEIAVTADNVPCQYEVGPLRVAFPLAGGRDRLDSRAVRLCVGDRDDRDGVVGEHHGARLRQRTAEFHDRDRSRQRAAHDDRESGRSDDHDQTDRAADVRRDGAGEHAAGAVPRDGLGDRS